MRKNAGEVGVVKNAFLFGRTSPKNKKKRGFRLSDFETSFYSLRCTTIAYVKQSRADSFTNLIIFT